MKQNLPILLLFFALHSFAQTEKTVKLTYNSVVTLEEPINELQLISNYYPLKSNIENKYSLAYVSEAPSLMQIENAAINKPSVFFVIRKNNVVVSVITLINKPVRNYYVVNPQTGEQNEFECNLTGDITENRANEIENEKYDSAAVIKNDTLYFNGKTFSIISANDIKREVLDLITKYQLSKTVLAPKAKAKTTTSTTPTVDIGKIVLAETKQGGKLDFFTPIKGKEYENVQIGNGAVSANIAVALYKWGRANFNAGIKTVQEALVLFAKFKNRELTPYEKEHIKTGFESGLKKK